MVGALQEHHGDRAVLSNPNEIVGLRLFRNKVIIVLEHVGTFADGAADMFQDFNEGSEMVMVIGDR